MRDGTAWRKKQVLRTASHRGKIEVTCLFIYVLIDDKPFYKVALNAKKSKHPTPMTIQLHPQCLLGIQGILRNWTFLIFKQV